MKKVFTFIAVALLALCAKQLHAQADPFDFSLATNYYLLVLDASPNGTQDNWSDVIDPNIVKDYRINGDYDQTPYTGQYFLDIWSSTFVVNAVTGFGPFDNSAYFDFSSLAVGWGGGGFDALASQNTSATMIDYTGIDDTYRFHMDIKKTNSFPCRINLYGGGDETGVASDLYRAQFIVGVGDHIYGDPVLPNLTPNFTVNTWQVIDIPVSQLEQMGWYNPAPFTGTYFSFEFGTDNGNNLMMDGVFFYKPANSGIKDVNANNKLNVVVTNETVNVLNATGPIDVYNLAGVKVKTSSQPVFGVDEVSKGAYIIKSGSAVAKVIIK